MKTDVDVKVQIPSFLISETDENGWSVPCSSRFTSAKNLWTHPFDSWVGGPHSRFVYIV
jgi:hypothetical protein